MNINFDTLPKDNEIFKAFLTTINKLEHNDNIVCSISGGSDSDVMLDLLERCKGVNTKVTYVFLDTGIEYKATHEHLLYLENKYDIDIVRLKPKKPIPTACKEYGQPFLNKQVSEFMSRLQKHGFKWENETFEVLIQKYPNCQSALEWWCDRKGEKSKFNISWNRYLKEFIIANPPTFRIGQKCCEYAKKKPYKEYVLNNNFDMSCVGVRKSEGGVRASAYKNCFSDNTSKNKVNEYRPIFWFKDENKNIYNNEFNVLNSDCYVKYGLKRTGCVGCPFGSDFQNELEIVKEFEPKLYNAIVNIFGDSYEYTKQYKEYVAKMKAERQ